MKRLFVCAALQIAFVSAYATWAILQPREAFGWLLPFVAVVWILVIYNNLGPIRVSWRRRRAKR